MTNTDDNMPVAKRGRGRPKGSLSKKKTALSSHRKKGSVKNQESIATIIRGGLLAGQAPEAILAAVKKAFPAAKTSMATIHNYRSQLRKQGAEIPTVRAARKNSGKRADGKATTRRTQKRTITAAIHDALLAGKSNDEVLEAVKQEFPKAKTSRNTVVIQRSALRKEGANIPSSWEANNAAKTVPLRGSNTKAEKTIVIASDHAGVEMKIALKKMLKSHGLIVRDLGTKGNASVDYPDYGIAVADAIKAGFATRGVVVCGSGIGISIAANRYRHVRAALCTNGVMAKLARQHNDANVLALGARLTGIDIAKDCLEQFLTTEFEGGRHQRRVDKMS